MNFDFSWTVSYGSKLCKKIDNFDNMYFESSKPTVEYHEYCSQDSNNVESRECIWKPLPPGLLESSSGGSNPSSMHPRMKSTDVKKETLRKDNFWMTDVQKTLR